jgi:preprotein translocase SecE subunit
MAVAVKTSPGARRSGTLDSPAILSLIGVLYLLACLAIVFKLLPDLWWSVWTASGLARGSFVGGSLLAIIGLAVGVGLIVLGSRLLGPNPPAGVRSGVFVAFSGLVIVLLLARWVSLWMEHWAYAGSMSRQTGIIITAIVGVVLLAFWVRLFTWPRVQKFVLLLEHGGWFHATAYKSNQGQKVRRATIFGILLLVGAGIYTLISHGTLRRGSPDWSIVIPFTGKVAVESFGDTEQFFVELPREAKEKVQVRSAGDSSLQVGKTISINEYQQAIADVLKRNDFGADADSIRTSIEESAKNDDPVVYLKKVDDLIYAKVQKLLTPEIFRDDALRRLNEIYQQSDIADLPKLVDAVKTEAAKANRSDELGPVFSLPIAVLVVDRYAMRDVNAKTDKSQYVKIGLKGDVNLVPPFNEKGKVVSEGDIVSRADFDSAVANLEAEKKKGRDRELPKEQALIPAYGITNHDTVTLLPSVQFTVPLLLLAVSLWLAWRIVNMPTFADFLIATEAELNKVSWTTQKRLVQDTIVVLTTVFLMAVFLFGMDWTWKVVLSWKPIGVLHIPKDASETEKKIEQKRW